MSSGPGVLQLQILRALEEKSREFHRVLLWTLALSRNEILKTGSMWGNIEEGILKKSFTENFMRALKSLKDAGKITVKKEKITDINSFIDFIPYTTSRLELFQLSSKLLPIIHEYIEEEKPSILLNHNFDFESYQIDKLRKSNVAEFTAFQSAWISIEKDIVLFLAQADTLNYDLWLNLVIQGRFLFRGRRENLKVPMFITMERLKQHSSSMAPAEANLLKAIAALIKEIAKNIEWQMGEIKNVLYAFCNVSKYSKTSLRDEFKQYLFTKKPTLLEHLPGHEEPSPRVINRLHLVEKDRTFSPLLDQLINRHILREQFVLHKAIGNQAPL